MENVKENKMGSQPVGSLLITMSLPIMISMLVQALYNVVDSIFVAKISEDALTAVSLAFPVQNLMIAIGAGTGVGINALLSKSLGEKNIERANQAANNGIFLIIPEFIIFLLIGVFFVDPFYMAQMDKNMTHTEIDSILNYGKQYMSIITVFSFGLFSQMTFEKLLQATGKTVFSMYIQGLGAIVNIILDPCFIFGLGFFPKLGVQGAALATVIGQCTAAVLGLILNIKFNKEITINPKQYSPKISVIKRIYAVGLPSIIMQSIGSVMTFGFNKILIGFSKTAVAVFGVYFKLQSFIFMPVFGLNNGLIPIMAFNYGARKKSRIMGTMKYAFIYAASIMTVGMLVMQLFPGQLLGFFEASKKMLEIGVPALRIICLHFVIAAFSIILSSTMQSLGHGIYAMIMSFIRQLVVLLPAAYLLSKTGNINNVWWSFVIAECASLTVGIISFSKVKRTQIDTLEDIRRQ